MAEPYRTERLMVEKPTLADNVTNLQSEDHRQHLRMLEAILFAAAEPLGISELAVRMPESVDIEGLLQHLQSAYASRGVNLVRIAGKWAFRTAEDLAFVLQHEATERRKLSRAAIETLSIIAYHQPSTRADIEEIRGVSTSKGTIDVLLETGWIGLKGRRKSPGRPVTYGTTEAFLVHFGLESVSDLPGLEELKQTGLLDLSPQGSDKSRQGQLFDPFELADEHDDTPDMVDEDSDPGVDDSVDPGGDASDDVGDRDEDL